MSVSVFAPVYIPYRNRLIVSSMIILHYFAVLVILLPSLLLFFIVSILVRSSSSSSLCRCRQYLYDSSLHSNHELNSACFHKNVSCSCLQETSISPRPFFFRVISVCRGKFVMLTECAVGVSGSLLMVL